MIRRPPRPDRKTWRWERAGEQPDNATRASPPSCPRGRDCAADGRGLPRQDWYRPRRDRRRDAVHPQHLHVPRLGGAGHVDVRRLHHARVGRGPHQERLDDLPEERRPLRDRRARLLRHRLRPDVRRRGQRHRLAAAPLRPDGRRDRPDDGRARYDGERDQRRPRHDVRLVLPDGLRRDHRLDRVRRHRRAREAVDVPRLHAGAYGAHLPDRRRLDVGRRLARRAGLPGLRRLDHRARHRRLGGARGRARRRAPAGQVPPRRQRARDAPLQRPRRDAGHLHPLAGLVRLQRRITARPRQRRRRRRDEPSARQHEPGGGGWRHRRADGLAAALGPRRPLRQSQRRDRGARLDHRGPGTSSIPIGRSSSAPLAASSARPRSSCWRSSSWTTSSARSPPISAPASGDAGGVHRRGWELPHPAARRRERRRVRLHDLLVAVAGARPDAGSAGVAAGRTLGPGQRRAGDSRPTPSSCSCRRNSRSPRRGSRRRGAMPRPDAPRRHRGRRGGPARVPGAAHLTH